jgi:hypothetical protein
MKYGAFLFLLFVFPAHAAEESPLTFERGVDCQSFGLSPESFQQWKMDSQVVKRDEAEEKADPSRRGTPAANRRPWVQSTIRFDTKLPADAVVQGEYEVKLRWTTRNNLQYDTKKGTFLTVGSEGKPPTIVQGHPDSYVVEKVTITRLTCSRMALSEKAKKKQECACPEVEAQPAASTPVPIPVAKPSSKGTNNMPSPEDLPASLE